MSFEFLVRALHENADDAQRDFVEKLTTPKREGISVEVWRRLEGDLR